jgi:glycosyltransferase involved in cell wall biosynthesis
MPKSINQETEEINTVRISAVVPTHNRCEDLRNTITSLQEQNYPKNDYEIIVVDNNSMDNTLEVVEACDRDGKKEVFYVKEPEIGLHNARHAGAKAAEGEILAYVDDDVICDTNWLSELVKPYSNPQVGCVGGKILPKWEAEPPEWIKQYPSYLSLLDLGTDIKELKTMDIYGCNFSIRRSLLFEVGGFNPDAFGDKKLLWYRGDGEIGLLRKVLATGRNVIYTPCAMVWHVIPEDRMTLDYFEKRSFIEGISASFSAYRTEKFTKMKLFYRSCKFGIAAIICKILASVCAILKMDSYFKYKFASSSFESRSIYEFKLIHDNKLREFAERNSWL